MCRDFARRKKYNAVIATQNGYVVTLRERKFCATLREPKQIWCDFAQPKTDKLRLRPTNTVFCSFAQLKNIRLQFLCMYVCMYVCFMEFDYHQDWGRGLLLQPLRLKMGMLRLCVTEKIARLCSNQNRYDATLRDPKKACCGHCDSKWVCCDFARPKNLRDFARTKTDMMRLRPTKTTFCTFAQLKNIKIQFICIYVCMYVSFMEFDYHQDWGRGLLLQPLRLKMCMLRLCVTEIIARFYAT